jgi:hypothetical protein
MTNYDTLKEYEAHKEPLPSYEEYKRLQEQIKEANEIIISFDKLVGKLTNTVFQNVLDYYKKYNVDRYKKSEV